MKLYIDGLGIWSPNVHNWADFSKLIICNEPVAFSKESHPPASLLSPKEKRRAPFVAKLVLEVAFQACRMSEIELNQPASIMCSTYDDSHILDYICTTLKESPGLISPTKFHNSVHNTTSGYWSICSTNRSPSTFVGNAFNSCSIGFVETVAMISEINAPVLLVMYDIKNNTPLSDFYCAKNSIALAILFQPSRTKHSISELNLEANSDQSSNKITHIFSDYVTTMKSQNPTAKGLELFELIALGKMANLSWKTNFSSYLNININPLKGDQINE